MSIETQEKCTNQGQKLPSFQTFLSKTMTGGQCSLPNPNPNPNPNPFASLHSTRPFTYSHTNVANWIQSTSSAFAGSPLSRADGKYQPIPSIISPPSPPNTCTGASLSPLAPPKSHADSFSSDGETTVAAPAIPRKSCATDNTRIIKKRSRTTADQLIVLQALFDITHMPTAQQRKQAGSKIGMSARAVQVWFQNKRQNLKKIQAVRSAATEQVPVQQEDIAASALLGLHDLA